MINQNWWFTTLLTQQFKHCPPLTKNIKCDVLIVGGGFTGVSAAAEFLGKGLKVVMIEKNIVGGSSTGKSTGFLAGLWGLNRFSYAKTEEPGVTYTNYKESHWGAIGPCMRGHLGSPEFSVFGQLSAVFGKVEQDAENNLTTGTYTYYRQEGNFQRYEFASGVWWYFTRRLGAEALVSADWTVANIRSGNVTSDDAISDYPSNRIEDNGGGWSVRLIYWFRLDKGAKGPQQP